MYNFNNFLTYITGTPQGLSHISPLVALTRSAYVQILKAFGVLAEGRVAAMKLYGAKFTLVVLFNVSTRHPHSLET